METTIWNLKKVEDVKDQKMTSADWHDYVKRSFLIVEPNGWNNYPDSFYKEEITKEEFEERCNKSKISLTCGMVSFKKQLFGS